MSRTRITAADKVFIVGNNDTMLVRQMSAALNLDVDAIRTFLKEQGMQTFSAKNKPVVSKPLLPDQQEFIKNNCADMTVSELARAVNNSWYAVGKYLKENKLKAKKVVVEYVKPVLPVYDVVRQKFQRPPAIYTNKQFN